MTNEEAIENLKGCICSYEVDKDGKPNGNVTADLTQEIIEMAIKALEQTSWISVSERLPKSDEEYHSFLVTDNKGNVTISEFYLSLIDKKPYWSGMINVIAWMPLPEPYKAESEVRNDG